MAVGIPAMKSNYTINNTIFTAGEVERPKETPGVNLLLEWCCGFKTFNYLPVLAISRLTGYVRTGGRFRFARHRIEPPGPPTKRAEKHVTLT